MATPPNAPPGEEDFAGRYIRLPTPPEPTAREAAAPAAMAAATAAGLFHKIDRFGLNVHPFEYEPAAFPLVAEARLGWVRLVAWWRLMERRRGEIDFSQLDLSVQAALALGLKVMIVFISIPGWANGTADDLGIIDRKGTLPPTDPQFFRDFVTAVVARFRGQRPYLERLFLFDWRDGDWPYPYQKGLGLVRNGIEGLQRKKSFWAVQDLALQWLGLPGLANAPEPADGATNVPLAAPLAWRAGRKAHSHRISLGLGSPAFQREQTGTTFPASAAPREYGRTYVWRVDEVGGGGAPQGTLWQFTVEENPASPGTPVIVRVGESQPYFLAVVQGQGHAECAPARSLVLPGTPEELAKSAWTAAASTTGPAALTFLRPVGKGAPDPLTIVLSGLRPGQPYRVFGSFVTTLQQATRQAGIRMGLDPGSMVLYRASAPGAKVVRQDGRWEEREVQIGSARAVSGSLQMMLDGTGAAECAAWSGLRLEAGKP